MIRDGRNGGGRRAKSAPAALSIPIAHTFPMTETMLQNHITAACRTLGLYYYHTYDSRRSNKGFPDLVIIGRDGVLFRELKDANPSSKPTKEQASVLAMLATANHDAAVWRPVDWFSGRILAELQALGRPTI